MPKTTTIYVQITDRGTLIDAMHRIPQVARAGGPAADAMMVRIGQSILGHIKRAFIVKARGGTDEAGERWAPLSKKTIAYSRGRRTNVERGRDNRPSQALNKKQQERWWQLYRQGLAMTGGDKKHAARRAWAIVKGEGAKTLFDKYSGRQAEILRDTGLLLNSLSPGIKTENQIFHIGHGEIVVGTNRKGAAMHHNGVPGRIPRRRLWPQPSKWPSHWWRDILEQARAGLVDITAEIVKGTSR
jgi:phage gpG-like protein